MDLKQIKTLMQAMEERGITKLVIKEEHLEIELERGKIQATPLAVAPVSFQEQGELPQVEQQSSFKPFPVEKEEGVCIESPVVGTFYSSPAPDKPSFVSVGDVVKKDTVVAIVEAMKVMNEVKAGVDGTIIEALVDNGNPVEFGTKLFKVRT